MNMALTSRAEPGVASIHLTEAVSTLREVILAGKQYRRKAASQLGRPPARARPCATSSRADQWARPALAQTLGFNTSSMTALIDRLERRGIAERHPDPHDRRRSTVRISEDGLHTLGDSWSRTVTVTDRPAVRKTRSIRNSLIYAMRVRHTAACRLRSGRSCRCAGTESETRQRTVSVETVSTDDEEAGRGGDLLARIARRDTGLLLFGMTPPRRSSTHEVRQRIADVTLERLAPIDLDGLVLYDIADETDRNAHERPFPYLPTVDPSDFHADHLAAWTKPVIV